MRSHLFAIAIALVGCGDRTTLGGETSDGGSADDASTTIESTPCSVEGVTGSATGVTISIRADRCTYKVGEAAKFTYVVTTDSRVPPIVIGASQGCGSCRAATDDPLAFVTFDIGGTSAGGQAERYCLCDVGCCAPDEPATVTLTPATKTDVIDWSGRTWTGPSDFDNPQGAFFPPGAYGVSVTFSGEDGAVTATLPIQIVP